MLAQATASPLQDVRYVRLRQRLYAALAALIVPVLVPRALAGKIFVIRARGRSLRGSSVIPASVGCPELRKLG